ncbi:MAG: Pyridoxamine 5'-phosphate oxidase [Bacteroidetes bacterium]|jgi:pyridoxamine 5'-phosphate oxidase|nr:Pyridoxamine 5'-phosphate oxidase [Bacteroidota bacterium]
MLRDIRKQYDYSALNEDEAKKNPFDQFEIWLNTALNSEEQEPTAMILSTVNRLLQPHSRLVLLKDFNPDGFVFYTNYDGNKAKEMAGNNQVHLLFFWQSLERQVRISGDVEKVPDAVSDSYFQSRPLDSRIGAWVSEQSAEIPSAKYLDDRFTFFQKKFGDQVPRPPHWGGYLVRPVTFEFWQGRPNRLHDRLLYSKTKGGDWKITRLAP